MAVLANYSKTKLIIFGICFICYMLGFSVFMNGLISPTVVNLEPSPIEYLLKECPQTFSMDLCSMQDKLHRKYYYNHCKKVVIIVIDALRADFIPTIKHNSKFHTAMNFTEKMLNHGSAISFITQGFAPTVTLPRIKTLVTGTVSNFLDVIINFNAYKLIDDNVLKQATLFGLKSVFYGDNTWLKLFPDLFMRSEGTHSFFVSDFKEVDFNVSRHIKSELGNKDWNIMILHFLGVDHIGHAYSPISKHLPQKIIEMDEIIELIYENLKNTESPSLIIVCGDHGMTTSGSHGGVTQDELLTPLIFINTANSSKLTTKSSAIIDQVDFAPTLSAILGTPIPINNFGNILPRVFEFMNFTNDEILYTAYYNLLQLSRVYKKVFSKAMKNADLVKETTESHFKWLEINKNINSVQNNTDFAFILNSYKLLLDEMKQDLLSTITGYNEFSMILGIIIMWISLVFSFHSLYPFNVNKNNIYIFSLHKIPKISVLLLFFISAFFLYYKMYKEVIFIPLCTLLLTVCYMTFLLLEKTKGNYIKFHAKICLTFLFVHALSLFSSSYIEEEHQTWYFLSSTITVLACCRRICYLLNSKLNNTDSYKFLYDFRLIWNKCSSSVYAMFILLITHRIFRKWNQGGNKWQHLPDISDWLNQKENSEILAFSVVISQFIILNYFRNKLVRLNYCLFCTGIFCISLQKVENLINLQLAEYITSMLIPWIVYLLVILLIISTFVQIYLCLFSSSAYKIIFLLLNIISVWMLLIEVIGRPSNIPLISVTLIQEYLLSEIIWMQDFDLTINAICYLIMAVTSFFNYGNSNSLSTVDVYTGYTGIQSYMPIVVTFLLICNTYSTVILWFLMFSYRVINFHINDDFENIKRRLKQTFLFLLDYKLFILALYSIVMYLMRHHLFIFSVFFPKLFYEFSNVVLFFVIYLFIIVIINRA